MIEHNHNWKDIKTYTLSEIGVFSRECMKLDRIKHDQEIITAWMGTNANVDYIKGLIKEKDPESKKPKTIDDDPEAKKKEWLRLARAFSGS